MRAALDREGAPELRRENVVASWRSPPATWRASCPSRPRPRHRGPRRRVPPGGPRRHRSSGQRGGHRHGEAGGRELNYYSDIDVMFVADDPGMRPCPRNGCSAPWPSSHPTVRSTRSMPTCGRRAAAEPSCDHLTDTSSTTAGGRNRGSTGPHQGPFVAGAGDLGERFVEATRASFFRMTSPASGWRASVA